MALAYILSGITTGSLAAAIWLGSGGSILGAFGSYTLIGTLAGLLVAIHSLTSHSRR
ncbi:hypothetical protein HTT03_04370 [Sulfitobacter sp. S0837]|uniref:hypothetical protein n=1 Tax=Sulfitobacter maritimus TaxID=2741719 RepID=UPI0015824CD0|nr:hypothetical protein [Sulfitobacter maritimus]NUH64538.1 hypothetical protein [Sulfitobacter maritimus]